LPRPRCQDGRGALPLQHRRQHRRRRHQLRVGRKAICRGGLRHGVRLFRRLGAARGRHFRPAISPRTQKESEFIMTTRVALLFAVASPCGSGVAAHAAAPADPDKAPVASVDRFSDKAAHLQLRTPDNHLPGPNQPVDFDSGPFITQGLAPKTGKPVRYYNFDVQTTTPAPVYVLYREGEDKPVAGQLDIIDTLPGEKGYN